MTDSKIFNVQDHMLSLLTSNVFFNDPTRSEPIIPVLSQRKGDIGNQVQNSVMNTGLCVLILLPKIYNEGVDQRIMSRLIFAVVVSENPTINAVRINEPAESVMEKAMLLIHWQPNLPAPPPDPLNPRTGPRDRASRFVLASQAATLMEPTPNMPSVLNYVINFETRISLP
jgi:hypothetical protein